MKSLFFRLSVVGLITVLSLGWVLWDLDWSHAWASVTQANWWWFVPMMLAYLLTHSLRTVRLWLLLGREIAFMRVFAINTIGFLAINVIPLRLGEMVRPYLLVDREGCSTGEALAAILLERLLDMLMLLGMLLGLTLWIELPSAGILIQGVDVLSVTQRGLGVLVVIGILGGGVFIFGFEHISKHLLRLPKGDLISSFAKRFRDGLAQLFSHPRQALVLFVLSSLVWLVTITAVACAMAAFEGIPVSLASAWSTWTITLCGMTAVPTPGFFGIYELCCSAALWIWGVEEDLAKTFAVTLHIGQFGFTLIMGGVFLFAEGLSLRSLIRPDLKSLQEPKPQPGAHH
jgi:glycosyltransferase 2 family protein